MKTTIKVIGVLMILISIGTVIYNVKFVKPEAEQVIEDPIETIKTGGENIQRRHDFKSPFNTFEVAIIALGVAGVVALVVPVKG